MSYAPILLFTYNRLNHTKHCIESLQKNALAIESELFIYSDAAKTEDQEQAVKDVRLYLQSITDFKKITIIERNKNWGLASNIIDGVTTQVKMYGKVIVLEDDLIVAPHFLDFMNDALELYKDEPKVGHIQACDFTKDPSLPDTFLIKWTGSWGWGDDMRALYLAESLVGREKVLETIEPLVKEFTGKEIVFSRCIDRSSDMMKLRAKIDEIVMNALN